jgi:putative transport protein
MTELINTLFLQNSIAQNLLVLAITISLGLTLGRITIAHVSIGVAGVMFAGLFIAQLGLTADHSILDFTRELGLIIFVYTIGVQVGPRFLDNFKNQGITLNLLAISAIVLSIILAVIAHKFFSIPIGATVGLLAGSTTNTPSLGAGQALLSQYNDPTVSMVTLAYAICYPMGIFGVIITMMTLKTFGKIDVHHHAQRYAKDNTTMVVGMNIKIENKNFHRQPISQIPQYKESSIVFSRLLHKENVIMPHANTIIHLDDVIRAVGPKHDIHALQLLLGSHSHLNIQELQGAITGRKVIITNQKIVGKKIHELQLRANHNILATRISHDDYELPTEPNTIIYYGDSLWIVGDAEAIEKFTKYAGNLPHELNHPFVLPLFFGMIFGIILGKTPIPLPGLNTPINIGLAGGCLLVAIMASRLGRFGHVVWYMPTSSNLLMRKFGISLFLAAVSLKSGGSFLETVMSPVGFQWFLWGCVITIIPIIIIGAIALWVIKLNFLTVCGLLAGSMTGPPALAFANGLAQSNAQAIAYSTVYPVVMILRIVSMQILILFLR